MFSLGEESDGDMKALRDFQKSTWFHIIPHSTLCTSPCVRCCSLSKLTIQTVIQISLNNICSGVILTLHTSGLTRFDGIAPLMIVGNMWISREHFHLVSSSHTHTHTSGSLGSMTLLPGAWLGDYSLKIAHHACSMSRWCYSPGMFDAPLRFDGTAPRGLPDSNTLLPESYLSQRNHEFTRLIGTQNRSVTKYHESNFLSVITSALSYITYVRKYTTWLFLGR